MSGTQFFQRQDTQRKYTRILVGGFIAAMLLVILVMNLVVIVGFGVHPRELVENPGIVFGISGVVGAIILCSSLYKASQLRAGGAAVAQALGGVAVTANDNDLKRQRLVNVVEEMAIAARIRKPQVFVLPDEEAINAFAAGHSPDEAAVAVTQGALDAFDREQLQAVIGHEFSHILNGDMKLNMRLAAWVFGLWVVTDLALRMLRGRARGKDAARLKIIALGIWAAGSVGMVAGRMLQAAISRRREHLADASAVQFTRNPGALQSAFVAMAANHAGTRLEHAAASGVAHMFIASSEPSWASRFGSFFATHPTLEERVRALDSRITPSRFKSLVSEERRRLVAKQLAEEAAAAGEPPPPPLETGALGMTSPVVAGVVMAAAAESTTAARPAGAGAGASPAAPASVPASASSTRLGGLSLAETMTSGVRKLSGRVLPPDVLRDRLSEEQQHAIVSYLAQIEGSHEAVQGAFVATLLASEPAKWRMQLTKLAPLLGIELMKETQAQIARISQLAPASKLPFLIDLLPLFENMEPAQRKRLRAVARAFAPTVAGDMLRHAVTRLLEKKLARTPAKVPQKAEDTPPPVPLPERAEAVCALYAALARCRFPAGDQGQNAYRAGLMGLLPPPKWAPYPDALAAPAQLDAAIAGIDQIHPTGKRAFAEGMARVISVGGALTVPQVDLLRATCLLVDCPVPVLPPDVVYEDGDVARTSQANAR